MTLVTVEELLENPWPLSLALDPNHEEAFDGFCPCAAILGRGFEVKLRCWRVVRGCSEIEVRGSLPRVQLQAIAEHIRDNNGWTHSTDWRIKIYERKARYRNQCVSTKP
jgi:hypothetical protein